MQFECVCLCVNSTHMHSNIAAGFVIISDHTFLHAGTGNTICLIKKYPADGNLSKKGLFVQ